MLYYNIFFLLKINRRRDDDVTILTAQINIRDINDHAPAFASGTFYIVVNENTEIGKEVLALSLIND